MATQTDIDDGGPVMKCRGCGVAFTPLAWQKSSRDYRCLDCKREQQNNANRIMAEKVRAASRAGYRRRADYWRQYREARKHDPVFQMKRAARRKVATEIEAGRLSRGNCCVCGSVKTDAHHDDYTKPLEIRWLCRSCHISFEKGVLRAKAS